MFQYLFLQILILRIKSAYFSDLFTFRNIHLVVLSAFIPQKYWKLVKLCDLE